MAKGGARIGAGRKPGVQNAVNTELKQVILRAFDKLGGEEYLIELAKEHPVAFVGLLAKIIPRDIVADVNLRTVLKRIDLTGGDIGPSD